MRGQVEKMEEREKPTGETIHSHEVEERLGTIWTHIFSTLCQDERPNEANVHKLSWAVQTHTERFRMARLELESLVTRIVLLHFQKAE